MGARNAGIDAVRIVGVLAVIGGHVWDDSVTRMLLYTWHVPLFFFISGYLWTPGRTMRHEVTSRWSKIGVPYLLWLVVIAVPFLAWIYRGAGRIDPEILWRLLLGGSYIGRPFSAFWFVGALFAVAVAYRALEVLPTWAARAFALCALAAAYLVPDVVQAVPLGIGTGLSSLVFVMAGRALRSTRVRRPVVMGGALLVVSAILVVTGMSAPLDLKGADFGTPVLSVAVAIAISAALVLLGVALGEHLGAGLSRVINLFAASALMVILTHAAVLWALGMPESGNWLYFAAATVISWAAAIAAVRTRVAPVLTGSPRVGQRDLAVR